MAEMPSVKKSSSKGSNKSHTCYMRASFPEDPPKKTENTNSGCSSGAPFSKQTLKVVPLRKRHPHLAKKLQVHEIG